MWAMHDVCTARSGLCWRVSTNTGVEGATDEDDVCLCHQTGEFALRVEYPDLGLIVQSSTSVADAMPIKVPCDFIDATQMARSQQQQWPGLG
jgi:hypothetical protein